MIKEAVYRSPKWLRKFIDYEVSTGNDINSNYLAAKRSEEEAKKKKEKDRQALEKELDELYDNIFLDFRKAPYEDKVSTPRKNGETLFMYTFENGNTFTIENNVITYTDKYHKYTYTLGLIYRGKFVNLANHIVNNVGKRPTSNNNYNNRYKTSDHKTSDHKTDDPNRNRYNLIKDKIKLREEQLSKLKKNDPDYDSLKNELANYKLMADKLKKKFNFEHLSNFIDFRLFVN